MNKTETVVENIEQPSAEMKNDFAQTLDKMDWKSVRNMSFIIQKYMESSVLKNPNIDRIVFSVNSKHTLDAWFYNSLRILSDGTTKEDPSLDPVERAKFELGQKDYGAHNELAKISKTDTEWLSPKVMEQFHKELLGKMLNFFKDLRLKEYVYNKEELTLEFRNFNFFGSNFLMHAIIKFFAEDGLTEGGRANGKEFQVKLTEGGMSANGKHADIVLTSFDTPKYTIVFSERK